MVNFGLDLLASLRHPCKFQQVFASWLRYCTCTALLYWVSAKFCGRDTYIRQGGHHVGHWPIFLVDTLVHLHASAHLTHNASLKRCKFNVNLVSHTGPVRRSVVGRPTYERPLGAAQIFVEIQQAETRLALLETA